MDIYELEDKFSAKDNRGPVFWKFLHLVALMYYTDIKDEYEKFFTYSLPSMIPCGECKEHYIDYIKNTPPDFSSRDWLVKWVLDFHNMWCIYAWKKQFTLDELIEDMNSY